MVCYFWWTNEGIYLNEDTVQDYVIGNIDTGDYPTWTKKDIITLQLNTIDWTLMCKTIKLENVTDNTVFYPVIRTNPHSTYQSIIY